MSKYWIRVMVSRPASAAVVVCLWCLICLSAAVRVDACSLPVEPDMKLLDEGKASELYEDEPFTWMVEPTRFPSIGYKFWLFPVDQSGRRQDGALGQALSASLLLPDYYKTFIVDLGGDRSGNWTEDTFVEPRVFGAMYNKFLTGPVAAGRRTSFNTFPFNTGSLLDIPGRWPVPRHHPNFERKFDLHQDKVDALKDFGPRWLRTKIDEDGDYARNIIVYYCPSTLPENALDADSDGIIKVVVVKDTKYIPPSEWEIQDWAVDWNMDMENIGYNVGERYLGTQATEFPFTYTTPSGAAEYQLEINVAVDLALLADWTWYEEEIDEDGESLGLFGPYKMRITGNAVKSSSGLNSSTATPESWNVRVHDKTPPIAHIMEPKSLYATTGDLISDWNGTLGAVEGNPQNPEKITIKVLENNPQIFSGDKLGNYDPDKRIMRALYSVQMYDYDYVRGHLCGQPGHAHPDQCDCAAVNRDKFVWVEIPVDVADATVTVYDSQGRVVNTRQAISTGITAAVGSGDDTDPACAVLSLEIPVIEFDEPVGWHFATGSGEYTDPWGHTHRGWENGGRLKYFVAAGDGSGNYNPPGWIWPSPTIKVLQNTIGSSWEDTGSAAVEETLAAADLKGASSYSVAGETLLNSRWDSWENESDHPAVWPFEPDITFPSEFDEIESFGTGGNIVVIDDDLPTVKININDGATRRIFSFGDRTWGDYKRAAYHKCLQTKAAVKTRTNKDTFNSAPYLPLPSGKPYSATDNTETDWVFNSSSGPEGFREMGTMINADEFNPWYFRLPVTPPHRFGLWSTEDIRLRFDLYSVGRDIYARDNINEYKTEEPRSGIATTFSPSLETYSSFTLVDGAGEIELNDTMSYVFRSPNVENPPRSCYLEVEVKDQAPVEFTLDDQLIKVGGPFSRRLKVDFYITRMGMSTITLEKKEEH